jgi:hypothetical protein
LLTFIRNRLGLEGPKPDLIGVSLWPSNRC